MEFSTENKTIAAKLAVVQAEIPAIPQSGRNQFHKYDYSTLSDFVQTIKPILAKHGLSLVTSIEEVTPLPDRTRPRGGTEHAMLVRLTLRLVCGKTGEWVQVHGYGENQSGDDKAVYGAITGARKYAMLTMFNLESTNDDPEYDRPVREQIYAHDGNKATEERPTKTASGQGGTKASGAADGFATTQQKKKVAALVTKEGKVTLEEGDGFGDVMRWLKYSDIAASKKAAAELIDRLENRKEPATKELFLKAIGFDAARASVEDGFEDEE